MRTCERMRIRRTKKSPEPQKRNGAFARSVFGRAPYEKPQYQIEHGSPLIELLGGFYTALFMAIAGRLLPACMLPAHHTAGLLQADFQCQLLVLQ